MSKVPEGTSRDILREKIDRMPVALGPHLDQPVSLKSILETKIAFMRDMLVSGLMRRTIEAYPLDMLKEVGLEPAEMAETAVGALRETISSFSEVCQDIPGYLTANGMSEAQLLQTLLNKKAMAACRAGNLTIAGLLELHPTAIIKGTQ